MPEGNRFAKYLAAPSLAAPETVGNFAVGTDVRAPEPEGKNRFAKYLRPPAPPPVPEPFVAGMQEPTPPLQGEFVDMTTRSSPANADPRIAQAFQGVPAGMVPQRLPGAPVPPPSEEPTYLGNVGRATGERAAELAGGLVRFTGQSADELADWLEERIPLGMVDVGAGGISWRPSTEQDIAAESPLLPIARDLENADLGADQSRITTWEQVKDAPLSNVLPFILETGIMSIPDMAAVLGNLPAYVTARSGEMGQARAENDGRANATVGDFLMAVPGAVGSALLERLGARGMFGMGDTAVTAARQVPKEMGRAGGTEALTEAGQEGIENVTETAGTERGFDPLETLDRMAAGAVGGGPVGAGVRGVTAGVEAATAPMQQIEVPAAQAGATPMADAAAQAPGPVAAPSGSAPAPFQPRQQVRINDPGGGLDGARGVVLEVGPNAVLVESNGQQFRVGKNLLAPLGEADMPPTPVARPEVPQVEMPQPAGQPEAEQAAAAPAVSRPADQAPPTADTTFLQGEPQPDQAVAPAPVRESLQAGTTPPAPNLEPVYAETDDGGIDTSRQVGWTDPATGDFRPLDAPRPPQAPPAAPEGAVPVQPAPQAESAPSIAPPPGAQPPARQQPRRSGAEREFADLVRVPRRPQTLSGFIRSKGGLLPTDPAVGDLRAIADKGAFRLLGNKARARTGLGGLPFDEMRKRAAESGYLPDDSTIADFLDAIARDVAAEGDAQRVYAGESMTEATEYLDAVDRARDADQYFNAADLGRFPSLDTARAYIESQADLGAAIREMEARVDMHERAAIMGEEEHRGGPADDFDIPFDFTTEPGREGDAFPAPARGAEEAEAGRAVATSAGPSGRGYPDPGSRDAGAAQGPRSPDPVIPTTPEEARQAYMGLAEELRALEQEAGNATDGQGGPAAVGPDAEQRVEPVGDDGARGTAGVRGAEAAATGGEPAAGEAGRARPAGPDDRDGAEDAALGRADDRDGAGDVTAIPAGVSLGDFLRGRRERSADTARTASGKPLGTAQRAAYLAGYDARVAEIAGGEAPTPAAGPRMQGLYERGERSASFLAGRWQAAEDKRPATEATDQGEQILTPGVRPVTDRDRAEAKGAKPLRSDKRQKPADDGLFDVAGRGQEELFQRPGGGPIRSRGIPRPAADPISTFKSDAGIKAHADYRAAKGGDARAAERLVRDLVPGRSVHEAGRRFGADVLYLPVLAEEASGRNKIPLALAARYAGETGAEFVTNIAQSSRSYHTGAKPLERLIARPTFEGPIEPGRRYVLVDDVTVMGGTLAEMADYVQAAGGEVAGVVTLVNAGRSGHLRAEVSRARLIERRYGDVIRDELDVDPAALTADEATYILGFRDADALRAAIARARDDRGRRLSAKGLPQERRSGVADDDSPTILASEKAVLALLDRIAPGADTLTADRLADAAGNQVYGRYVRGMIQIALDAPDALATARHEAIHYLRAAGHISPDEWRVLVAAARKQGWIRKHKIKSRYPDLSTEAQLEEAVAEAYPDWAAGRLGEVRAVDRVFRKIKDVLDQVVAAVREALGMEPTWQAIFGRIEAGQANGSGRDAGGAAMDQRPRVDPAEVTALEKALIDEFDLRSLSLSISGNDLKLGMIAVPADRQGQGVGTQAMARIIEFADSAGLRIVLTAGQRSDGIGATSQDRLKRFYKRLGFVENKGRGKDFSISEGMYREPGNAKYQRPSGPQMLGTLDIVVPSATVYDTLFEANAPLTERLRSTVSRETIAASAERARELLQDRFVRVKATQAAIEKLTGKPLSEAENVYLREEMYTGRVGDRLDEIARTHKDPLVKAIVRSQFNGRTIKIPDGKGGMQEAVGGDILEAYLYARHAPERNAQIARINPDFKDGGGSGMTDADAAQIMRIIEAEGLTAETASLAGMVDDLLAEGVDRRVEYGLMSAVDAAKWRDTYKHYVPLRGLDELDGGDDVARPRQGKGYSVRGPESKRALGRGSRAKDILANAFVQADEAIVRGEKNRVFKALHNLVVNHPDPDLWEINRQKMAYVVSRKTGLVEHRPINALTAAEEAHTVRGKVNGQEVRIAIHDPYLARAMKSVGADQMGPLLAALGRVNRYLSSINTGLNPEFVVTNALRDIQSAGINLQQHDLKGITADVLANYRQALAGAYGGIHGKRDTEWQKIYADYTKAGGKVSFWRMDDINDHRRAFAEAMADADPTNLRKLKKASEGVLAWIENLNIAVDNGIRLAAFEAARKRGLSDEQAASLAKNLTVNFNRRGRIGPAMNALYMFYNAGIQGTAVLVGAMRSSRVRKVVAGVAAAGFIAEMLNAMLSPEDDDGELLYDKIGGSKDSADFLKSRNMVFVDPTGTFKDGYVTIPLPYGYNVFWDAGRNLAAYARGAQTGAKSAGNLLRTAIDMFNPIGSSQDWVSTIAPTLLKAPYELTVNKNFMGGRIYPEPSDFDKSPMPYSAQPYQSTSTVSKEVAAWLNDLTGGDRIVAGEIDVPPQALDHLGGWVFGAAGRFWSGLADVTVRAGTAAVKNEPFEWSAYDIPFARKVVRPMSDYRSRRDAYDAIGEIQYLTGKHKDYQREKEPEKARAWMKEHGPLIRLGMPQTKGQPAYVNAVRKRLTALRKERFSLDGKVPSDDPRLERNKAAEARLLADFAERVRAARRQMGEGRSPLTSTEARAEVFRRTVREPAREAVGAR